MTDVATGLAGESHALGVAAVAEKLGTDPLAGLRQGDVAERLLRYGPNKLEVDRGPSRLAIFLGQLKSSLVWVLLAAALISGAVLREWVDTIVILAIVVLNAVLGYVQESRAEAALAALQAMSAPEALVRREGQDQVVPAAELVPGDIVVMEAGDRVPADCRLLEALHFEVDEAPLTGESLPVLKTSDPLDVNLGPADRTNMGFAGTTVTAGRAGGIVVATGNRTEFGRLAELVGVEEPSTPLELELDRVGKQIAVLAVTIAVVIFGLGIARQIAPETMFLTAVALAVAAIPEGLTAVVTMTLSRGVTAMAKRNAIVRRLPAAEALGSTSVICSDKTGTLTQNLIRVQEISYASVPNDAEDGAEDTRLVRYAQVAVLCNDARELNGSEGDHVGDPTEVALLVSLDPDVMPSAEALRAAHPRIDEVAFDSERKRMSTLHTCSDGTFLQLVKGAPEVIVERTSFVETGHGPSPLRAAERTTVDTTADRIAAGGLRTLAVAYRLHDTRPDDLEDHETDLTLVAIVGMSDELRPEASRAVSAAQDAGVAVVMITGDHQVTAEAVGRELGILDGHQVMGGNELRARDVDDLARCIDTYRVFARVDPADKVKIVQAWQQRGAVVAMTGDGVNDAPALRGADIGVSMGSGTAVAREASSMILADDNFATIVSAVEQGRAIFANLKKVVYFLLSANASEVLVMLVGFALFGSHGEPLLATQLLWINLVTDGLPALALGVDTAQPGLMQRSPEVGHHILGRPRQLRILWQGAILAAGALGVFVYGFYLRDLPFEDARTLLFTAVVFVQMAHTYNVRSEGSSLWRVGVRGNRFLAVATCSSLLLQLLVVYTPQGNSLFKTTPIAAIDWIAIVVLTIVATAAVAGIQARRPVR